MTGDGGYRKHWNISLDLTDTRVLDWEISPSIFYALKISLHNKSESSAPIVSFAPNSKIEYSQSNESDFTDFPRQMKTRKKGFCLQYT